MNQQLQDITQRLTELRRAFDDAFAAQPVEEQREQIEFLFINVGEQTYALRLTELAGLEADRKIVPVPLSAPALLGLCAVGGHLVPVFDLAQILGAGGQNQTPRWLVLYRDRELIGLAFDETQGSRRMHADQVHPLESHGETQLSKQAIQLDGRPVHVVDLAAVALSITQAIHPR